MGITLSADGKHARARVSWRGKQSGKSHGGGAHPGPSRLKLYTWFASKAGHLLELKMDACAPAICQVVMGASVKAGRDAVYKAPGGCLSCSL